MSEKPRANAAPTAASRERTVRQFSAQKFFVVETMIFNLSGSGLPISSKVFRPITTVFPVVNVRKRARSTGIFHGIFPPFPITRPIFVNAAITAITLYPQSTQLRTTHYQLRITKSPFLTAPFCPPLRVECNQCAGSACRGIHALPPRIGILKRVDLFPQMNKIGLEQGAVFFVLRKHLCL